VPGSDTACEPSSLRLVGREHLAEEVIEVRLSIVDQSVGLRLWFLVKLHDLMVGRGQQLTSPQA
jgi:hypothetical protein